MSSQLQLKSLVKSKSDQMRNRKNGSPGAGIHCRYIKVNKNVGIKCYTSEVVRDGSCYMQTQAAEHGLGPKVYNKLQIDGMFCYVTEHVEIRQFDFEDTVPGTDDVDYGEMIDNLQTELKRKINYMFTDVSESNVGFTKSGRMVCIDFGEAFNYDRDHRFGK